MKTLGRCINRTLAFPAQSVLFHFVLNTYLYLQNNTTVKHRYVKKKVGGQTLK